MGTLTVSISVLEDWCVPRDEFTESLADSHPKIAE